MDEKWFATCQIVLVLQPFLLQRWPWRQRKALEDPACMIGVVVSTAWLCYDFRWTGLSDADRNQPLRWPTFFFALPSSAPLFIFGCGHKGRKTGQRLTVFSIH